MTDNVTKVWKLDSPLACRDFLKQIRIEGKPIEYFDLADGSRVTIDEAPDVAITAFAKEIAGAMERAARDAGVDPATVLGDVAVMKPSVVPPRPGHNGCPAAGCRCEIPRDIAFCKSHWVRVPRALQMRIWGTYRRRDWPAWRKAMEEAKRALDPPPEPPKGAA